MHDYPKIFSYIIIYMYLLFVNDTMVRITRGLKLILCFPHKYKGKVNICYEVKDIFSDRGVS